MDRKTREVVTPLNPLDPMVVTMHIKYEEVAMHRISWAFLLGVALISLSACADIPGNTQAAPKVSQAASCDWLLGYPDCEPPGVGTHANATAVAQAPAS